MTQKNAALVEEGTAAAQSMATQAAELEQQMAYFKLSAKGGQREPAVHRPAHRAATPPAPVRGAGTRPAAKKTAPVARKPASSARPATSHALRHAENAHNEAEWKEF